MPVLLSGPPSKSSTGRSRGISQPAVPARREHGRPLRVARSAQGSQADVPPPCYERGASVTPDSIAEEQVVVVQDGQLATTEQVNLGACRPEREAGGLGG